MEIPRWVICMTSLKSMRLTICFHLFSKGHVTHCPGLRVTSIKDLTFRIINCLYLTNGSDKGSSCRLTRQHVEMPYNTGIQFQTSAPIIFIRRHSSPVSFAQRLETYFHGLVFFVRFISASTPFIHSICLFKRIVHKTNALSLVRDKIFWKHVKLLNNKQAELTLRCLLSTDI